MSTFERVVGWALVAFCFLGGAWAAVILLLGIAVGSIFLGVIGVIFFCVMFACAYDTWEDLREDL